MEKGLKMWGRRSDEWTEEQVQGEGLQRRQTEGLPQERGSSSPGRARAQEVGRSRELTLADINNFDNDNSDHLRSPPSCAKHIP